MSMDLRHFLNINKFLENSVIGTKTNAGILRQNKFMCLLHAPSKYMPQLKDNGWLEWNVLSVDCPNISVSTEFVEVNSHIHYYLKSREDSDLSITFIDDANLSLRNFFYTWINEGFNHKKMARSYIDDCCAEDMLVIPLSHDGIGKMCDKFEKVFPYEINSLDYDFASEDAYLKTTVKFKYRFHTVGPLPGSASQHIATKKEN